MSQRNLVLRSINDGASERCVDIFRRADASVGFEEYRRDVEDGRGWFAIGGHGQRRFSDANEPLAAALLSVPWLRLIVGADAKDGSTASTPEA